MIVAFSSGCDLLAALHVNMYTKMHLFHLATRFIVQPCYYTALNLVDACIAKRYE